MTKKNQDNWLKDWDKKEEMIAFIKKHKIESYIVFSRYCALYNKEWLKMLIDYPGLSKYFKSHYLPDYPLAQQK